MLGPKALLEAYETPVDVCVEKGHYGITQSQSMAKGERLTVFFARQEDVCVAEDRHKRPLLIPANTGALFKIFEREPKRTSKGKKLPKTHDLERMSLANLVQNYKLPLTVTIVKHGDDDLGSKSSRTAVRLLRMDKVDNMFAVVHCENGTEEQTSIPLTLDVAFTLADPRRAKPRKHKNIYDHPPEYEQLVDTASVRGIGTLRVQTKRPTPAPPLPPRRQTMANASGSTPTSSTDGYMIPDPRGRIIYDMARKSHQSPAARRRSSHNAGVEDTALSPAGPKAPTANTSMAVSRHLQDRQKRSSAPVVQQKITSPVLRRMSEANGRRRSDVAARRASDATFSPRASMPMSESPTSSLRHSMHRSTSPNGGSSPTSHRASLSSPRGRSNVTSPARSSSLNETPTHTRSSPTPVVSAQFEPPPADEIEVMSVNQVCDMLTQMNLERYHDCFGREQISGYVFLELDDSMLKDDLEISNRLHRVRILKAIERSKANNTAC